MNFKEKLTKKIAFSLIISILSLNLFFLTLPKAEAGGFPVIDAIHSTVTSLKWVWDKVEKYTMIALVKVSKIAAAKLISMIMMATADWIKGGFNGNPAYISDINRFLGGPGGVADQTVGQWFSEQKNLAFLCDPFKIQVSLALRLGLGAGDRDRMSCTLTAIRRNVDTAVDNASITFDINGNPITKKIGKLSFADEGGWDSWLRDNLQPQNNPIGAYQIAKANLDAAIVDAKGNKIMDLNFGQGAVPFKRCIDTYVDEEGKRVGESAEYSEGSAPPIPKGNASGKNRGDEGKVWEKKTKCNVATPGSAITAMVTGIATTDIKQNEMTAALANGFDAIIGALMQVVMQKALSMLNKGVLDNSRYADYNSALDAAMANTLSNYNSNIASANAEQNQIGLLDWNNLTTWPTSTIQAIEPITVGTSTWNYNPALPPTWNYDLLSTSTPPVISQGPVTYSPLDQAKNNSNILINSLLNSEMTYQNTYLVVQNVLTQARGVFATSSACNINYNRNDYVLRALLIRANVITNIDGRADSDRTIANIPWNFQVIKAAVENSNGHIAILNKAKTDVNKAGSITAVTDAMINVNSTDFNTDPQAMMVENAKTWLRGVGSIYNSILCPINLTEVLKITTAATSSFPTL